MTGQATLSGTIALFTADDKRYDVPFPDTLVTSEGTPAVVAYRFPAPVVVTDAYVAALGGASAGPCAIAYPWSKSRATPSPKAEKAIAGLAPANVPIAVTASGTADPLKCGDPDRAVHTISAAMIRSIPYAHGTVDVRVTITPDGAPIGASVVHSDPSLNDGGTGNDARADAIRTAMHSTFAPATFRCRPIIDTYDFNVQYN